MFCTTHCLKPAVIDGAIAKHFSDIQFHIYIAKSCFVLLIARSQLLLVGHLQNSFQIFSFTYLFIMFCTITNCMKPAVIDGTFANIFSDMGTSHRGGSALLSWRIQSQKRSNQTVCFSKAGDFLTCFTLTMLSSKPKQKSFFYKAETFTNKNENKNILSVKFSFLFESEFSPGLNLVTWPKLWGSQTPIMSCIWGDLHD